MYRSGLYPVIYERIGMYLPKVGTFDCQNIILIQGLLSPNKSGPGLRHTVCLSETTSLSYWSQEKNNNTTFLC